MKIKNVINLQGRAYGGMHVARKESFDVFLWMKINYLQKCNAPRYDILISSSLFFLKEKIWRYKRLWPPVKEILDIHDGKGVSACAFFWH